MACLAWLDGKNEPFAKFSAFEYMLNIVIQEMAVCDRLLDNASHCTLVSENNRTFALVLSKLTICASQRLPLLS